MAQTSRLVLEIDSRDAEQKAADMRKALGALEDAGIRIKPAMDKAGASIERAGKSADTASKSFSSERDEIESLLGRIDPLTKKLGELDKQEQALAAHRKSGKIDAGTYDEYQSKITATRMELGRFSDSMNKTGNSAKQNAAALRMLPAQFSDIAISLQGGQAPLTVFLQQGSQIKDSFGGAAEATRALGGYIAGMVNPLTVGAAAAAALVAVFIDAEREVSAFNKALFSGTASSGQTASSLSAMSKTVSAITGDFSEANAAVIALAGSAKLSQTQFANLAQAAASIAEFSGKSAADVAKSLGDVGDSATKAAEKISVQYGLLTSAQYGVIAALDDQGKKQEALDALSGFLNEGALKRLTAYKASLSDIERDWNNIGTAISNAYSKVKAELFPDLPKQAEIIERILKSREDGGVSGAISNGLSKLNTALGLADGNNDDSTEALQKKLASIRERLNVSQQSAVVEGETGKAEQARIEAMSKWDALHKKNLFDQVKLEDDIKEAKKLGLAAGRSQVEIDKEVASIQAKYDKAQPKTPKPKAYTEDSGQKLLDEARQRFAVLQQQGKAITDQTGATATLGTEAKKLIELETMLADLKTKGTLTASQKQILVMGELNVAQQKLNAGLEKRNQLSSAQVENAAKLKAYQDGLNSELELAQEGLDNRNSGAGLGDRASARLQEELKIRQDYQKKINKLTNDYTDSPDKSEGRKQLYEDDVAAARAAQEARLAMQQDSYSKEEALRNNWLAGTSTAWQNYVDIATNYNQQAQDATAMILGDTTLSISDQISGLLRGTVTLGEAFANLGTTMANSVITALSDIAAQWVVTHALKMAGITAETGAVVASESAKATAKVTADGIAEASSLSTIATTLAANISAAVETLASWAPAALVASIGSFGAAAVVGGGAIIAAYALIKGLTGGFSSGGYTGPGGVNDPAGVVHKGEVVWSQADISRFGGVAAVESLRKGNVSPISSAASAKGAQSSGGSQVQPAAAPITVQLIEDASRAGQVTRTQLTEGDVLRVCVSSIYSEGDLHEAMRGKYGLSSHAT